MKKILILLLCILTIFIGFLLYKKVNQGIDAYNYQHHNDIDFTEVKTLPVDDNDVFESYTHQTTTYPLFESDVLKSTIHYTSNFDTHGIMVCHIDDDQFVINSIEEFSDIDKKVNDVTGGYVIIWPKKYHLNSGIQGDIYETDDHYYMLVHPQKKENVLYEFETFTLQIVITDL